MMYFPTDPAQVAALEGQVRAGGTDLTELRHKGLATGPVVDLRDVEGLDGVEVTEEGGLRIGSKVTLATIAADPVVNKGYQAVAQAAGGLATPQIRARASLGGSLLQEVRCWYFRSPQFQCAKRGGVVCLARRGDARFHSAYDKGQCIAPHPSTMAMALLAYGAQVEVDGEALRTIPELLGPGAKASQTHAVAAGELVTAVVLPPPVPGEHAAYRRTIHRMRAEWPLVEAAVRVSADGELLSGMHIAVGGVANRPLAFPEVAAQIDGKKADDEAWNRILDNLAKGDLPQAAYKARLVPHTIRDTLAAALQGPPAEALIEAPTDEEAEP